MKNIIQFFNKAGVYILFLIFGLIIIFLYVKGEESEKENEELEKAKIRSEEMTQIYLNRNNILMPKIDSLVNENSKLLNELKEIAKKDKNIIIKYNEKIKVINKFGVSDMQSYFNENFGSK